VNRARERYSWSCYTFSLATMDGQLYIQHFENESDKILIYFNRFDYNIDLLILNIQLFFSDGLSFINS
jgi:hypothetical protein